MIHGKLKASGGQSRKRTVYAGDSTGKQIVTAMTQKCLEYEIKGKIERKSDCIFIPLLFGMKSVMERYFIIQNLKCFDSGYADAVSVLPVE